MSERSGGGARGEGPQRYEIRVRGHLSPQWSAVFDEAEVRNEPGGEAVITAMVPDQASLHGLLARLHGLGLPLVSVNPLTHRSPPEESE
ncbi:MAG: hypothetical protein ACOY94_25125 [Bacillota bacterium]